MNSLRDQNNSAFTIIEMLVVVAVIGLLSSVILTALGPARDKAKDSRIIQEMNQVRSLAETFYNGYNYDALESLPSFNIQNADLKALSDDISAQGGELSIIKSAPAPAKTYSAFSQLNQKGGDAENPITQYYCIDSAGHSLTLDSPPTGPVCR